MRSARSCRGSIRKRSGRRSSAITPGTSLIFAIPNIFLISALLFALATVLRSMMAAYIGAIALVMGYLVTTSVARPEDRISRHVRAVGAARRPARLRGDPLLDPVRDEQPARRPVRHDAVQPHLGGRPRRCVFLGLTLWRFSMTERAPSSGGCASLAKREARKRGWRLSRLDSAAKRSSRAMSMPSRWAQFVTRLRVEVRQVLTSPGLIVLTLLAIAFTGVDPVARPVDLRHPRSSDACRRRSARSRKLAPRSSCS